MRFLFSLLIALPALTLAGQSPPALPNRGKAIEAMGTIDRGCRVYPADTLTLAAAHERYGVICRPVLDPHATPLYGFPRPARPYGRIVLSVSTSDTSVSASIKRPGDLTQQLGVPFRRVPGGTDFVFDSVVPGSYELFAMIQGGRARIAPIQIRAGELWELFYVSTRQ